MRKSGRATPFHLLLIPLLLALAGCGASNSGTAARAGSGSLSAKLVYGTASVAKVAGKRVASVVDVTQLQMTVTGAGLPVVRKTVPAADPAQVDGIYPGTVSLVVKALDASGATLYEGFAPSVPVVSGGSTDVGTITMLVPVEKTQDTGCIACHETTVDESGLNLVAQFKQSGHYTNASWTSFLNYTSSARYGASRVTGTGCAACHGPSHNDPSPAASGRCYQCHGSALNGIHQTEGSNCGTCHQPHNTKLIINGAKGIVSLSGHDDPAGAAWTVSATHKWRISGGTEDFSQTIPVSDCVRCHTAEGFAQFAAGAVPFSSIANLSGDPTVSMALTCNGCHKDVYAPRAVTAVRTFYNVSTVDKVTKKTVKSRIAGRFPDVGQSNICISCHSGRVVGPNLSAMFASGNWDLSNTGFQNSHYMAAAGTMYMKAGFKNFTTPGAPAPKSNEGAAFASTQTYDQTLSALDSTTPDGVAGGQNSAHRRLGTPAIAGSEDYLPAAGTSLTTNGPCVTCHMQAYEPKQGTGYQTTLPPVRVNAGHSLQIDEGTAQQLCLPCHADAPHLNGGDGAGTALYTSMTSLADLESAMLEPQSAAFQNGLALIGQLLLAKYDIKYDGTTYPYFFDLNADPAGKTQVTDWTRKNVAGVTDAAVLAFGNAKLTVIPAGGLTQVQAYRLMGACFNLNLLSRDPGAYLHARTYSQRLVYDTIDFLDDNLMDFSALDSARTLNPAVYHGKEANVLIAAPVGGLATESMAWLAGTHYSDSKGQTPVPLRLRP